ncbi:MAG: heparan-alpha-glucosaminide N-acetyltransferase domain-containing protein [Acidobacteriota bacterium]
MSSDSDRARVAVGAETSPAVRFRIDSIDVLRGIVMVIMMLDHTRDFVHSQGLFGDPTNLQTTTPLLFLTRWITHFCAPVFIFLAGTGAYLQWSRRKNKAALSKFLLTRGLWLIFLECTAVKLGAFFTLDYRFIGFFQVIWAIGVSMIVLAGLVHLPLSVIAAFGLAMIGLHNFLDRIHVPVWFGPPAPSPGWKQALWMLLHQQGGFQLFGSGPFIAVVYPLIPWIGVMAVGYAFGALYQLEAKRRRRLLLILGGVVTGLFVLVRFINRYGDPSHWRTQKSGLFTVLSFLNTTKYPPSLLFLLMTLGPALLALAWFEFGAPAAGSSSLGGKVRNIFVTYGRVPLFFYLLQWPTAHLISVLLHLIAGKPVRWLFMSPLDLFSNPPPQGIGFNLGIVYVAWLIGVVLLYPLCKWFAGVKARRRDWWLSYL